MTIDEAIKHAEEVAAEKDVFCKRYDDASGYTRSHNEEIRTSDAKKCEKCAEEHRQLAEWLKDYKRLLEQEPNTDVLDKIRAEIDKARFIDKDTRICKNALASGLEVAMQIIDKYKAESEDKE